jgi:chromosome segregation ATPase
MLQFLQHALQPHDSDGGDGSRSSSSSSTSHNSEYARALVALTAGTVVGALWSSAHCVVVGPPGLHSSTVQALSLREEDYRALQKEFTLCHEELQHLEAERNALHRNWTALTGAHDRLQRDVDRQAHHILELTQRDQTRADTERELTEAKRALTREKEQLLSESSAHAQILDALEEETAQLDSAVRAAQAEAVVQRDTLEQNDRHLSQKTFQMVGLGLRLQAMRKSKDAENRLLLQQNTHLQAELAGKIQKLRTTNIENRELRRTNEHMRTVREREERVDVLTRTATYEKIRADSQALAERLHALRAT